MRAFGRFRGWAAATLAVMVMAAGAAAQTWDCGETPGTVTCTLSDGTFTVSGSGAMADYTPGEDYKSSITNVIIEDGVTSIGEGAFRECTGLTSVTIGSSVTSIGGYAFLECSGLTSVTIPNNVTYIGGWAFASCTSLKSIEVGDNNTAYSSVDGVLFNKNKTILLQYPTGKQGAYGIPNSVTSIEYVAFRGCTGLTSVTIPNSVTDIGAYAFSATGLTSVTIGNSVTYIGYCAFSGCTGLTSITIPNSVTSIEGGAFSGCTGLTSVTIPNNVTSIGWEAFWNCTGLTSVTIGNSVTSIGWEAFYGCASLTSVTIPNSVTSIEEWAFSGCTYLTSIEVSPNNLNYSSDNGVLFNKDKTILLQYPTGKQGAYGIPNSVTSIGRSAFWGCGLTSITIPNSVTDIGDYAFSGIGLNMSIEVSPDNLNYSSDNGVLFNKDKTILLQYPANKQGTSYIIPNSVTSIGERAFYSCGLTSITIPNSVTSIGWGAFLWCTSLTSVTIPNNVTSIGDEAFMYSGMTSVISLPANPPNAHSYSFYSYSIASLSACLYVPEESISAYRSADGWNEFSCVKSLDEYVSVASHDRVIPPTNNTETAVVSPVSVLTGELSAGPNPVGRSSGAIAFFWQGKQIKSGALTVYDASGNVVRKLSVKDNAAISNPAKRAVGLWDLKEANGRQVPEGTYLVKGKVVTFGGKAERAAVVVGVR